MIQLPMVSVVMPIRNEGEFLAASLNCALEQDYPRARMEVIVADGISTDGTREIVRSFQEKHPNLMIVENPGMSAPAGLNAALKVAKGEVIVRIDGHTEVAPDYVRQCVSELQRTNADNVGGKMVAVGQTSFGRAVASASSTPFGIGGRARGRNSRELICYLGRLLCIIRGHLI